MTRIQSTVVITIMLLAFAVPAAAIDFNVILGLDSQGEANLQLEDPDVSLDADSSTGYSLGLEMEFDFPIVEVAAGLEYGFNRGTTDCTNCPGDLDYRILYGMVRVQIFGPLYLAGRLGYSDVSTDELGELVDGELDGKETWGLGVGASFVERFRVELLFNNVSAGNSDLDFDYEMYSLRLIYTF